MVRSAVRRSVKPSLELSVASPQLSVEPMGAVDETPSREETGVGAFWAAAEAVL